MSQLFSYNGRWVTLEFIEADRKAEGAITVVPEVVVETVEEAKVAELAKEEAPYCTQCTSKGGRHLKSCPLYK